MNCNTCNKESERIKRTKLQKILLPDSKRYFCAGCNKRFLKTGLLDSLLSLFKTT